MATELRFTILLAPVPKGRPRVGRWGHTYTPERTRAYESTLAAHAVAAMARSKWPMGFDGKIGVSMTFATRDRRRVDIDNLAKCLDAFNKLIWKDDSQILELHAYKTVDAANPRTEVRVWVL